MKITNVRSTLIRVPYSDAVRFPGGTEIDQRPDGYVTIIVELETDEGVVGIGESVRAGLPERQLEILDQVIDRVLGADSFDIEGLWSKMGWSGEPIVARTLCGLESAIWDAMAKASGQPLCKLLGGVVRTRIPFMPVLHRYPKVEAIVEEATESVERGFKCFMIKVGALGGTPEEDLEVIEAVREAVGPGIELVMDANGAWSSGTAIRMIRKMERYDPFYVEDPVSKLDQMVDIRKRVQVPICAHGFAASSPEAALEVIRREAADVIVLAHRNVGIHGIKKAGAIAEAAGIPAVLHSAYELGLAKAVMVHLAASTPSVMYPNQTQYEMIGDDIITGGRLEFVDGCLQVPEKPGIGVEIDGGKLEEYAENWKAFRRQYPPGGEPPRLDVSSRPKGT